MTPVKQTDNEAGASTGIKMINGDAELPASEVEDAVVKEFNKNDLAANEELLQQIIEYESTNF